MDSSTQQTVVQEAIAKQFEQECAQIAKRYQDQLRELSKAHRRLRYIDWFDYGEDEPLNVVISEVYAATGEREPDEMRQSEYRAAIGLHFDRLSEDEIRAFERKVRQEQLSFYFDDYFYDNEGSREIWRAWRDHIGLLKSVTEEKLSNWFERELDRAAEDDTNSVSPDSILKLYELQDSQIREINFRFNPTDFNCKACMGYSYSHDETGDLIAGSGLWLLSTGYITRYCICESCKAKAEETNQALTLAFAIDEKNYREFEEERLKLAAEWAAANGSQSNSTNANSGQTSSTTNSASGSRSQQATNTAPNIAQQLMAFGANDEGNAQSVYLLFGQQFLYCDAYGYLHYNGKFWESDGAEVALDRAIVATLQQRCVLAIMNNQDAILRASRPNAGNVKACLYLFRSLITASVEKFDADPELLNCNNGVVNLRTGGLISHDPAQRFTYCVPVDYVPGKDYIDWMELLAKWLPADQLDVLQLMTGYSATGHTREEVLGYLFGPTRSGKGTFTETIGAVLSSKLAAEIEFSTFTEKRKADNQNFDLAPLKPSRVVFASESNEYERLNEAKVKLLTGGNQVRCAFKHRDPFNYRPQFKIWLSSNHRVNADPDDDAVWGRIRIFHFPNSFLGKEDKTLKQRLRTPDMMEQVLAWIIKGAAAWYQLGAGGIQEAHSAALLKREMRDRLDTIAEWIKENCQLGPQYDELNSILYGNYETWCKANGVTPKKQRSFSDTLERKGYQKKRITIGMRWIGIKVK